MKTINYSDSFYDLVFAKNDNYCKFYIDSLFKYEFILFALSSYAHICEPKYQEYKLEGKNIGITQILPVDIIHDILSYKQYYSKGYEFDKIKIKYFFYEFIFDVIHIDNNVIRNLYEYLKQGGVIQLLKNPKEIMDQYKEDLLHLNVNMIFVKIFDDEITLFYNGKNFKIKIFVDEEIFVYSGKDNIIENIVISKYKNVKIIMGGLHLWKILDDLNDDILYKNENISTYIKENYTNISLSIIKISQSEIENRTDDELNYEKIIIDMLFLTFKKIQGNF